MGRHVDVHMVERTIEFDNFLSVEARKEWDAYWAASPHSAPRQNAAYGDVESSQNHRVVYVTGKKNGELAFIGLYGLSPFLFTKYIFGGSVPSGSCI